MPRWPAATLAVALGCAAPGARQAQRGPDSSPQAELSPEDLSAKVAAMANKEDPKAGLPRSCFAQLYEAMRKDNPAYYACLSRCVKNAGDLETSRACEDRERCADRGPLTATPAAADPRVTEYCRRMLAIDGSRPRMGMHSCVVIASWARPAQLACMAACAEGSASQEDYQACLTRRACAAD